MRRRRAILYDDDTLVLGALALFFEGRGYDVIASGEPTPCAVYGAGLQCDRERPCADILVTDLAMPGMSGIQLLQAQARRGCTLNVLNKAVISGSLDVLALEAIRRLGCAWFDKPFRLAQLAKWVGECESRMDLSRPLGPLRKEQREACRDFHVTVGLAGHECVAEVVNRSRSGMCLRVDRQLAVEQMLDVRTLPAAPPERCEVRWTKPEVTGTFLAGAACG